MLAPAVAAHLNEVIKSQDFVASPSLQAYGYYHPVLKKHFSLNELYEVQTINFSLKSSALCTWLDYFSAFLEVRCEYVIECDQWNIDRCGKCHIWAWLMKTPSVVLHIPLLAGFEGGNPWSKKWELHLEDNAATDGRGLGPQSPLWEMLHDCLHCIEILYEWEVSHYCIKPQNFANISMKAACVNLSHL